MNVQNEITVTKKIMQDHFSEIASKYTVHPTQISAWKKQALAQLPEAFTGKQKQTEKNHATELSELYEQIGRLKVENAFLKKKCDLFSGWSQTIVGAGTHVS